MDCVVMDGTAAGILGELPQFDRICHSVLPYDAHAAKQYVIQPAHQRRFLDSVFRAALRDIASDTFELSLEGAEWYRVYEHTRILGSSSDSNSYNIFRFLSSAYNFVGCEGEKRKPTNSGYIYLSSCIKIAQKFDVLEIIRAIADFGLCFCGSSIAGAVLRKTTADGICSELEEAFVEFSNCNYSTGTPWIASNLNSIPCKGCPVFLLNQSRKTMDLIPSASFLGIAVNTAVVTNSTPHIRQLSAAALFVIKEA